MRNFLVLHPFDSQIHCIYHLDLGVHHCKIRKKYIALRLHCASENNNQELNDLIITDSGRVIFSLCTREKNDSVCIFKSAEV